MNARLSDATQVFEPADRWTIADASELYDVMSWGKGYFSVDDNGHVRVHPNKEPDRWLDLKQLVDRLQLRGIDLPILIRFAGILKHRLGEIHRALVFFGSMIFFGSCLIIFGFGVKINRPRDEPGLSRVRGAEHLNGSSRQGRSRVIALNDRCWENLGQRIGKCFWLG